MKYLTVLLALLSVMPFGRAQVSDTYRIHRDDLLVISVWGEQGLSQRFQVARDGTIYVPLIGTVKAEGLTPQELADFIARKYVEEKYLRDPKVSISIEQFHRPRVAVLGMVNRPGVYEFKYGDKVLDALSFAGHTVVDRAALEKARLIREDNTETPLNLVKLLEEGDVSLNYTLKDNDTIFVPEDTLNRIFVGGQVPRPGQYPWRRNMTVLDALGQAGWNNERGTLSRVFVVRGSEDGKTERIQVNMIDLLNNANLKQNIYLQPGDVVYVPQTRTPDLRKIGDFLSTIWLSIRVFGFRPPFGF